MSTENWSRFFASLALFTFAATLLVIAFVIARRLRPESGAATLLDDVAANSLWLAAIVAAVTTAGSLYYSLGAHFTPCDLCWYQRICVYPLAVVLPIAALRRDFAIWRYTLPPAAAGIVIAAYHSQLQAFPKQSSFCPIDNPCTARYVWQFGFVSLPLMDLAALTFIAAMLLLARDHGHRLDLADDGGPET